jgi:hypothetical protein
MSRRLTAWPRRLLLLLPLPCPAGKLYPLVGSAANGFAAESGSGSGSGSGEADGDEEGAEEEDA